MTALVRNTALCIVSALFVPGTCFPADLPRNAIPAEQVLERFAIFTDGDGLLLPVELNGKQYLFLVDTGATNTVYDSSLRAFLGEPTRTEEVETPNRNVTIPLFKAPDARLGRFSLRGDSPVLCMDMSGIRRVSGHAIYGILGMDFLGKHVFHVDPKRGELVFLRVPSPAALDRGRRLQVSWVGAYPHVEAHLPGRNKSEYFLVDTGRIGHCSGDMTPALAAELATAGKSKIAGETFFESAAGTSLNQEARVESFTLAGTCHRNLLFGTSRRNTLGLAFLIRCAVTYDFANNVMYLQEGCRLDLPDLQDMSGLHLLRSDGRTMVMSVDPGSPAALAGVRPEDILLKVETEDTEKMRLHPLRRQLCAEGQTIHLTIKREATELCVPVVLQDWRQKATTPK
jgi:Aspartyl protease/PDZ domain